MDKETFIHEFINVLKQEAQEQGGNLEVYPSDPDKGILQGAAFKFDGTPIALMVYPERFYPHYTETAGMKPLLQTVQSAVARQQPIDFESFKITRDKAQDHLVAAVVNYKENRERLRNIPHERFLDLALIAKWKDQTGYCEEVKDWVLSELHMTKEEAFAIAKKNTFSKVTPLVTLEEYERQFWEPEDYEKLKRNPYQKKMFVLTTQNGNEGAAVLADKSTLDRLHKEFGEDFYILPVENWKTYLVKKSDCPDVGLLMKHVLEEKSQIYDWSKTLSKNPYLYDGHKLRFAGAQEIAITDTLTHSITHRR